MSRYNVNMSSFILILSWTAFKRGNALCRKTLKCEKRKGWKHLCSEFSHKTPTSAIWKFIRAYKNKSLSTDSSPVNYESNLNAQDQLLNKLCPSFCLFLNASSPEPSETSDSARDLFAWIDNPFTTRELESAIYSSKKRSSPWTVLIIISFVPFHLICS